MGRQARPADHARLRDGEGLHRAQRERRLSKALVIGGSLGGLFAANLLSDLGWDVEVFERVGDDLASRGAGIGTHTDLVATLAKLGIPMDQRLGHKSTDRTCVDAGGRVLYKCYWGHTMSAWANVYRPLKDRFSSRKYFFGKAFKSFSEDASGVAAFFEDGSSARGDLLIGADGLRSSVRGQLYPDVQPQYAGYVAWRSIVDESTIPDDARKWLHGGYWFVLPPNEMFLAYQVPAKGRLDWNYVWYHPVGDAALRELCTDASGRHHPMGIAPQLIRPQFVDGIKREAARLLPPHLAHLMSISQPFFQPIYDIESPRMVAGRVCLLGDAAFVARPHVGAGVTKAAMDALCLSNSLAKSKTIPEALTRYDRLRGEYGRRIVARARRLGSYIEAKSRPQRGWTPDELDQRPEKVLHEVALALEEIPELALEV